MSRKHRKNHKVTFKVRDYKFKSKVKPKSLKLRKPVVDTKTKVKEKKPTKTSKISQNADLKVVNKKDSRKLVDFRPDEKYVKYLEVKDKFKSKSKSEYKNKKEKAIAKGFACISFIIKKNNIFFTCQNDAHKTEKGASKIVSTGMIQVQASENENENNKIKKRTNKVINTRLLQIKKEKIKKMKVSEGSIRKNLRVFLKNIEKYSDKKTIKLRNFRRVRFLFFFLKVKSDLRKKIMLYVQRKWKKKIGRHVNTIFFPSLSKTFNGCRLRRPSRVKGKQKNMSFKSQR